MLDKFSIARALREIGILLELKGENYYKVRAYETGATMLESLNTDLGQLVDENKLQTIRGVGEALAAKIAELYLTGRCEMLERLREEMPPGVIELSQVPGLTPKRIKALHEALDITSIAELRAACDTHAVSKVKGFGAKTEQTILEGIRTYETREEKILLHHAQETAAMLESHMRTTSGVKRVEVAGAIRRWADSISSIDLVVETSDAEAAIADFKAFPLAVRAESATEHGCVVRLTRGIHASLFAAQPGQFAAGLLAHTGARAHFEHLKLLAETNGLHLDETGVTRGGKLLPAGEERDLYIHLGLPYIPPELREDWGEIEEALAGADFEDLVANSDVKGLVHCHTQYSDGRNSVEEMARAGESMGMEYITITDHSPAAHYAGGLTEDRLKRQWDEIDRAQEKVKIKILRGTESDILEDGALDYPDRILEKFDVIIASVHSRMKMDSTQMTARLINCMKLPVFKIWGHALGRLVLRREPFACDVDKILDAVAESKTAIEVNGDPHRLDMEPRLIRLARQRNIPFVISTDAHSARALGVLPYGVHTARRGGLRRHEVLNTLSVEQFRAAVKPN